jgi:16S rRNA (adenine1518-N6/adenine1519-N6)-dimethyltransferase
MKLAQIRHTLDTEGIRLTKSLGQNFLHDQNQLARIAQAADLGDNDSVLEIGPGLGCLTSHLLGGHRTVMAIETDNRLVEFLTRHYASTPQLQIVHADALRFLREHSGSWQDWKCVSNLPYSVASPILVELAIHPSPPARIVTTVQTEVADRIRSPHGSGDYGILSLLIQANFEPGESFKIPPPCFFPPPNVDSTCITLHRRKSRLLGPGEFPTFCKIVKRGFSQRRKMMIKLLKADWNIEWISVLLEELGLDPKVRAEQVSLDQFVRMTQGLMQAKQNHDERRTI